MYRPSDPQLDLFDAGGLLPPEKQARLKKTWAEAFRLHALPILRSVEDEFAVLFDPDQGRPNRPVELLLGTLILKEMHDLTDVEALEQLEYSALWWWALRREPREMHLAQKTLHNFRRRLMDHDLEKLAFRRVTDAIIQKLGVEVGKQRLDSTLIFSNVALLTRLQLFCETIWVFLQELKARREEEYQRLPAKLLGRHSEDSSYRDARKEDRARRLGVAARDAWRLLEAYKSDPEMSQTKGYGLLKRLVEEQCRIDPGAPGPKADEDDAGESAAPVSVKPEKEISSYSLQSPHDPELTYDGHKRKNGYRVQVAETCGKGQELRVVTDVAVTLAAGKDTQETVPAVERLIEAGHKPAELLADTLYSGGENAATLAQEQVRLVAPAVGKGKPKEGEAYPPPAPTCPTDVTLAIVWLRQQEADPSFEEAYADRAGIESTNAELKGPHGMRKLRVRGQRRVSLAVYFKTLAMNVKRALRAWRDRDPWGRPLEALATRL